MRMSKQRGSRLSNKISPIHTATDKVLIGWQEWCALSKFHLPAIKAKIDTGAKTSVLHASDLHPFHRHGRLYVHFIVHPLQRSQKFETLCTAEVIDERTVMNSGGHKERRYIVLSTLTLGEISWDIEIGLTNRDPMAFRMLLGRDALKNHSIIDPGKILIQGKLKASALYKLYIDRHSSRSSL